MSLRDVMNQSGGQINPKALQQWTNKYRNSLRAIDEVEPGFSGQFNNLANSQSALASKFVGAANVDHATQIMGNVLGNKQSGPLQLRHLVKEAGGDPGVVEGLKKLAVDHMVNQASASAGAGGNFGPHLARLIDNYKSSLPELFDAKHLQVMKELAEDSGRQQQTRMQQLPSTPGSPTAHRLELLKQRMSTPEPMPVWPVTGLGGMAVLGSLLFGGQEAGLTTALGAIGAHMATRLANTMRARGVKSVNDMYTAGMVDPELGIRMLRHGSENMGDATWLSRVNSAFENSPYYAQPGLQDAKKREGRASGGKVGVDHAKAAAHLVDLVTKARKTEQAKTKPLLGAHDTTVARALELANRAI